MCIEITGFSDIIISIKKGYKQFNKKDLNNAKIIIEWEIILNITIKKLKIDQEYIIGLLKFENFFYII